MKNKKLLKSFMFYLLNIFLMFYGCTEYKEPALINNPNRTYSTDPVVSGVIPPDSAIAGVREITVLGNNFLPETGETLWVYIGGKQALIKNISSDRIIVHRPALKDDKYGIPVHISVVKTNALGTAKITNYKVEKPFIRYGNFSNYIYNLFAIEVDKQENLYIATRRRIIKFDGFDLIESPQLSNDFAKITDLKFGPGGFLYVLIEKADIYRVDVNTWKPEKFITLPNVVSRLDFDANGNLYAAKDKSIYVVNPDKTIFHTQKLDGVNVVELRVYNNNIYAASRTSLYKIPLIDKNGNLGEVVQILNLQGIQSLSNCEITSFTISQEGTFYMCLKNHPKYSLFVLENDGSVTPFYADNILPPLINQITWGNGRFVYLNRGTLVRDSVRVYKMGMDRIGATYLGR